MTSELDPEFEQAMRCHQSGRLADAERLYRLVLSRAPGHPMALHYLGLAAHQQGRASEGIDLMRQSTLAAPHQPVFHLNLAQVLHSVGRREEAIAEWQRAVALDSNLAQGHAQLGICLGELGRLPEAIASLTRALKIDGSKAESHNALGNCLMGLNSFEQAEAAFRRATELRPTLMVAWNNLGNALRELGRLGDAEAALRRAIELAPDHAAVHSNLGHCLQSQGRIEESLAELRTAAKLDPNWVEVQSNLLMSLHYDPELSPQAIFEEHRQWAAQGADVLTAAAPPHRNSPDPDRRLRVGYVSHNLTRHSVAYFLEPILASHDPRQVEVTCYADVPSPDETTARIRQACHRWRGIVAMSDERIADLVRSDQIDILVDAAGHTSGHLLRVFARKPAPVQVTYIGYPDTTGMRAMDYRLTDAVADPEAVTDAWHTERLVRLPGCAWCYRPPADAPPVAPAPTLANGHVTFGSFNNVQKLNDRVLDLWAQVLCAAPGSRLLLKAHGFADSLTRQRVLQRLEQHGVDRGRIDLLRKTPAPVEHLADYARVDVGLDPFPYNGTATTCEALWMGAPVITLAGTAHVSRVGASLLGAIGLNHLVASTGEEYVRIAASLSADVSPVAEMRSRMREKINASALRDEIGITRAIEAAYRRMWARWCAGRLGGAA